MCLEELGSKSYNDSTSYAKLWRRCWCGALGLANVCNVFGNQRDGEFRQCVDRCCHFGVVCLIECSVCNIHRILGHGLVIRENHLLPHKAAATSRCRYGQGHEGSWTGRMPGNCFWSGLYGPRSGSLCPDARMRHHSCYKSRSQNHSFIFLQNAPVHLE